jgi:hypothetical protein
MYNTFKTILIILFIIFNTNRADSQTKFAVIGDFGDNTNVPHPQNVADVVNGWDIEFIVTLGDNYYGGEDDNYAVSWQALDDEVGQYYSQWIGNYQGTYGDGSVENNFFPALGNHDWYHLDSIDIFLDYFSLPGNERYYDFFSGNVHIFVLSNYGVGIAEYNGEWPRHGNYGEPDGVSSTSTQGQWLQNQLSVCTSTHNHWRIVFGHYSPYKGNKDDPTARWPYKEWGAHIFFSSHDHFYQVLEVDNFPYIINGVGGTSLRDKHESNDGTEIYYEKDYGACYVEAQASNLFIKFYNESGVLRHIYQVDSAVPLPVELVFFAGIINNNYIELEWRTETEVNNYGFEIERARSFDTPLENEWIKIGFVEGNGNSNSPIDYSFTDNNLGIASKYYYRLKQIDIDGSFEYSDIVTIDRYALNNFDLSQNYPNPFNPSTKITYSVPELSIVTIKVFDILGNEIETLVREERQAGTYEFTWNSGNLPGGIYFYRLQTGYFVQTRKMTLLK